MLPTLALYPRSVRGTVAGGASDASPGLPPQRSVRRALI